MSAFKVGDRVVYGITIGPPANAPKKSWGADMVPLVGEILEVRETTALVADPATGRTHVHPLESLKPAL